MSKRTKIGVAAGLIALLGGLYAAYSPVAPDAKLVGESLAQCKVTCQKPCFCNRTCVLTWCWGPWYCQCRPQ